MGSEEDRENKNNTISRLEKQLFSLSKHWKDARNTETHLFFTNPRKTMWANFLIGMSRGVGFVIGVSIVGAISIAIIGWILSKFVSIPLIGEYIADIVKYVQDYLNKN